MKLQKRPLINYLISCLLLILVSGTVFAQKITRYNDSLVVSAGSSSVSVNYKTGRLNYHFGNGVVLNNTVAYVNEVNDGLIYTSACRVHQAATGDFENELGKGVRI